MFDIAYIVERASDWRGEDQVWRKVGGTDVSVSLFFFFLCHAQGDGKSRRHELPGKEEAGRRTTL